LTSRAHYGCESHDQRQKADAAHFVFPQIGFSQSYVYSKTDWRANKDVAHSGVSGAKPDFPNDRCPASGDQATEFAGVAAPHRSKVCRFLDAGNDETTAR